MPVPINRPMHIQIRADRSQEAKYERTAFGKDMLKHFLFDPAYKNLNHGSFGAHPRDIRDQQRILQDEVEQAPDSFIRYKCPKLLKENRESIAKFLDIEVDTIVLVTNATTAMNTVIRNIQWHEDGRDEILYFNTIYGSCGKTVSYMIEYTRGLFQGREINLTYPISDANLVDQFKATIAASRAARKVPRLAVFDTISAVPGLRVPFEALTAVCKEQGILSCIDGAHGIGQIPISLSTLQPDFFFSNLHKWLFVPRGCAVLYVPFKNQSMIRTSLPTGHGFVPKPNGTEFRNPIPPTQKNEFVNNFEFVGTTDITNYLVIRETIRWREEVCGGEEAINKYCINLARDGTKAVATILGTEVLDNDEHSLTDCCLSNALLPLTTSPLKGYHTIKEEHVDFIANWMQGILDSDYKTFLAIYSFQGKWWARFSSQVYLEISDYEWAGYVLKDLCERVGKEEFLN